ncbi:polysaccharide biosynthesis tyrosine autokinase [Nocardioides sp. R1-1]|uniref:polysaccharide biosynthesis tyrosine autokinase n=1 Tax=Nocardioides sp. R1-1 TaxID=3383502 RepID=UPI0038D13456
MQLEDLIRLVKHRWLPMLLVLVATVTVAVAWTETRPREYTARASGIVATNNSKDIAQSYSGTILAQTVAKSYLLLFTSRGVAEAVIAQLGLDTTPEQLIGRITATLPTDTTTIRVAARAPTPAEARDIANAVVRATSEQIATIQGGANANAVVKLVPVEPAGMPTSQSYPSRVRYYGAGLVLGVLLALGWGVLREHTDTKVRGLREAESAGGAPALGVVPATKNLAEAPRDLDGRAGRSAAEAFRQMRTNLRFVAVDEPPRAIVVTSSVAGEGKSTVAANLARVIASGGQRVVLVDGDLRRPTVHEIFDLDQSAGLSQVIAGTVSLEDALQETRHDGLQVLTAGRIPHNPSELLGSNKMRLLLERLRAESFVVIDSPPLLPVTDGALLTAAADGALLVARSGVTRRAHLAQASRNVQAVDGRLLGLVMNGVSTGRRAARNGYGYYAGAAPSYHQVPGRRIRHGEARVAPETVGQPS